MIFALVLLQLATAAGSSREIAAFETVAAQRRNAVAADRASIELRWLQALRDVLASMEMTAGRDAPWPRAHADLVSYDEIGGSWMISIELLDKSYASYSSSGVADEIAWLAVTNGLGGECEGDIPCYLSGLNELYGKYLRRLPRGAHRQEAVDAIAASLRMSLQILGGPNAGLFFDETRDCGYLLRPARALRAALVGAGTATSEAVALLDRLIARCPHQ